MTVFIGLAGRRTKNNRTVPDQKSTGSIGDLLDLWTNNS